MKNLTGKKAKKMSKENLYIPPDEVTVQEYPGCCGAEIAEGFYCTPHNDGYAEKGIPIEQWHKKALKRIDDQRTARHVQLSIVTKYKEKQPHLNGGKEQVPGFKDFLLGKGWYVIDEFVNPNHGNTVCILGKTYLRKKKRKFWSYNWR